MADDQPDKKIDVFGVGNAMVDILAQVTDDFVREHGLAKGSMSLVDTHKQGAILHELERYDLHMQSGGSAANTIIAVAQSGGAALYTGKVSQDTNGEFYRQDLLDAGVQFDVRPAPEEGPPTGTCLVLTTPDAERTMCTHLGVSTQLHPSDLDMDRLAHCRFAYVEGYLWDPPEPRQASIQVMQQAKRLGVKLAFTFSDAFLIDRFRDDFRDLAAEMCDVVFCNADEAVSFTAADDLAEAARQIGRMVPLAFVTDGARGALVVHQGTVQRVDAYPVDAVDTVGAGDAFAGGVLYGLTHGFDPVAAARWGNYLASQVVRVVGARLPDSVGQQAEAILGMESR